MTTTDDAPENRRDGFHHGYTLLRQDDATGARRGVLLTRRGEIQLPAFMPVGTQASVKSLSPDEVAATGSEILLANTYHLMLRPGVDLIRDAGGLHRFMAWERPILTDSGGFQVFSLAHRRQVSESGVDFRSHIDGSRHQLTPERAIDLQIGFDSDIIMPLDDVVGYESDTPAQQSAMERTHRWLDRAVGHFAARPQVEVNPANRPLLFGIAQGGFDRRRRRASAGRIAGTDVDGSAIGGLSVGEPKELMGEMLAESVEPLPSNRPRYLMGVGSPEDLWQSVALGVDMFDCVHPTRVARRGALFTPEGRVNVTSARFRREFGPVDPTCDCQTCTTFTAAYLHHLFRAHELLAYRLATIHNLRFIQRLMGDIRRAIDDGIFLNEMVAFIERYRVADLEIAREQKKKWAMSQNRAES